MNKPLSSKATKLEINHRKIPFSAEGRGQSVCLYEGTKLCMKTIEGSTGKPGGWTLRRLLARSRQTAQAFLSQLQPFRWHSTWQNDAPFVNEPSSRLQSANLQWTKRSAWAGLSWQPVWLRGWLESREDVGHSDLALDPWGGPKGGKRQRQEKQCLLCRR